MHQDLLSQVYQHPLFTADDVQEIVSRHTREHYRKGDFLLQKGAVADDYYIVEAGLVRSFVYDYEDNDITIGFSSPGGLVIEVASIFQRVPTAEYIQWRISYESFQELFHTIPACREWGRGWMAYALYQAKVRSIEMITLPASKRYMQLLEQYPEIIQQVPLKYIASYLGVTDTSLSRIRKEVSRS
jgi:CRP-like cAMP-binding protein